MGAACAVKHYLEQGFTKTAIAERVGVSRRTIHYWLASGQLDRPIGGSVRYPPRATRLDRYKAIITERLETYPELTAVPEVLIICDPRRHGGGVYSFGDRAHCVRSAVL